MGTEQPLTRLPVAYAVALALRDAGVAPTEIAERLGLPPESMPRLLELAEAKLARVREDTTSGDDDDRER